MRLSPLRPDLPQSSGTGLWGYHRFGTDHVKRRNPKTALSRQRSASVHNGHNSIAPPSRLCPAPFARPRSPQTIRRLRRWLTQSQGARPISVSDREGSFYGCRYVLIDTLAACLTVSAQTRDRRTSVASDGIDKGMRPRVVQGFV